MFAEGCLSYLLPLYLGMSCWIGPVGAVSCRAD